MVYKLIIEYTRELYDYMIMWRSVNIKENIIIKEMVLSGKKSTV